VSVAVSAPTALGVKVTSKVVVAPAASETRGRRAAKSAASVPLNAMIGEPFRSSASEPMFLIENVWVNVPAVSALPKSSRRWWRRGVGGDDRDALAGDGDDRRADAGSASANVNVGLRKSLLSSERVALRTPTRWA